MKEIVRITLKNNGAILLTSLREKNFIDREISVNFSDRYHLERVSTDSEKQEAINNPNKHKLIAHSSDIKPIINISDHDQKEFKIVIKQGLEYAEIECDENGYPILDEKNCMIIYAYYSQLSPSKALERIKEFNEKYTNNHKLTPGLHESS